MYQKGRAWIEIDREKLCRNITVLNNLLPQGCELMPAVKANAYGHGAVLIAGVLNEIGIKAFCVATIKEGIELRRGGIEGDILVLGYTCLKEVGELQKYDLIQTVVDEKYAENLNDYGEKIRVHIKIDTGMHRNGERCENREAIKKIFELKNLKIEGVYTHLCVADSSRREDVLYTRKQGQAFYDVVSWLERERNVLKKHLLSSYGLMNYPELSGDYARVGIALYGVFSRREDIVDYISLHPVLSIKARVAVVKDLLKGESAGYGLMYTAECNKKIAVLAIGYADGVPRALSCGKGRVLMHGYFAPIIGRICMDQMLVDVTEVPEIEEGDTAIVLGEVDGKEVSVYEWAEQTESITNEVLSRLGGRLERILV